MLNYASDIEERLLLRFYKSSNMFLGGSDEVCCLGGLRSTTFSVLGSLDPAAGCDVDEAIEAMAAAAPS